MTNLVKVFVGDGSSTSTTNPAALVKGDLKLQSTVTGLVWNTDATVVAGQDMQILGVTDKGLRRSSKIVKNNITNITFSAPVAAVQKVQTVTFTDFASVTSDVSKTFEVGVNIYEDMRMGTYNRDTNVVAQWVSPSSMTTVAAGMNELMSKLHLGFTANPLTSSGSGRQMIKVERTGSGTITALGQTLTVVQGSRQVTAGASLTIAAGAIVSIVGKLYLVEKGVTSGTVFTLDTAYQGASATVASGTNSSTVGTLASGVTANTYALVFTGVAQTPSNKYDQYRLVNFDVNTPRGFTTLSAAIVDTTAIVFPVGTYGQIRDLEEKYATQVDPIIMYRNWPSENFPINATSGVNYNILAIEHYLDGGDNLMQASQKRFDQVTIVAIADDGGTNTDEDSGGADDFATMFNTWYGSTIITS